MESLLITFTSRYVGWFNTRIVQDVYNGADVSIRRLNYFLILGKDTFIKFFFLGGHIAIKIFKVTLRNFKRN